MTTAGGPGSTGWGNMDGDQGQKKALIDIGFNGVKV